MIARKIVQDGTNGPWPWFAVTGVLPALETDQNKLNKLDFDAQVKYWRDLLRHHLLKHAIGLTGFKKFGLKGRCSLRAAQKAFGDLGEFTTRPGKGPDTHFLEIKSLAKFANFASFEVCRYARSMPPLCLKSCICICSMHVRQNLPSKMAEDGIKCARRAKSGQWFFWLALDHHPATITHTAKEGVYGDTLNFEFMRGSLDAPVRPSPVLNCHA